MKKIREIQFDVVREHDRGCTFYNVLDRNGLQTYCVIEFANYLEQEAKSGIKLKLVEGLANKRK